MATYNWDNLSSYDFEIVCQDIMSLILKVRVEAFPAGPDRGIDLRAEVAGELVLGQCKHYFLTGYQGLSTALSDEVTKLQKMTEAPGRYLLFTTARLSPQQKDNIFAKMRPFMKSRSDIYGLNDLEFFIAQHAEIEKRHYKLWLSSIAVIEAILASPIQFRNTVRQKTTAENLRTFVQVAGISEAWNKLREHRSVIISGAPGVGKTTLAEMVAHKAILVGYEAIYITTVDELESSYKDGVKQVFIYDDFLGRTNLSEMMTGGPQERLTLVIDSVKKSPDKLFILTTREYLFREAEQSIDRIREARLALLKISIEVSRYTPLERAQILYNHLRWRPEITEDDMKVFVQTKAYRKVIDHHNFTPRLIVDTLNQAFPAPIKFEEFDI